MEEEEEEEEEGPNHIPCAAGWASPPRGPSEPLGAQQGLCTWQCWRHRVLEHLGQGQAPGSHARGAQVTFEDVAVRFSPSEWAQLAAWQKDLYWEVMEGNHEAVASLVPAPVPTSEVLCRIERGEPPPSEAPPEAKREGRLRSPARGPEGGLPHVGPGLGAEGDPCHRRREESAPRGLLRGSSPAGAQGEDRVGAAKREPGDAPAHDCKERGQSFPGQEALLPLELCAHLCEQAQPCALCGRGLGSPGSLAHHSLRHHPGKRVFACVGCTGSFLCEEQEARQIRAQLALGKLFRCLHCHCSVALLAGQKPGSLCRPSAFGQPATTYCSSSRQRALDPARQRAAHWSSLETKAFVGLWGEGCVQAPLYDNYRNEAQYQRLSDRMGKMGFRRNLEQCRQRTKDLRRGFKEIRDGHLHSNRAHRTLPFFALLKRFLTVSRGGLVVPKACVHRAKQRGRKEPAPGAQEPPVAFLLPPESPSPLRLPGQEPLARVLGLANYQLQRRRRDLYGPEVDLANYALRLPDPLAHVMEAPSGQLRGENGDPSPHTLRPTDFPLRLQEDGASLTAGSGQVSGCGRPREVPLPPIRGLTAAVSSLWSEITGVPAEQPPNTTAQADLQAWRPGKAPSSSAKRMRDLRLRRRRQRAAMAQVLLGASFRPSDRTVWSKTRKTDWWDNLLLAAQPDRREWARCFRMSREAVLDLAEQLRPVLQREDTNMRAAIPVDKRVALALWKLASSDSYRSVAHRFGVGVSTASVIVMEVCEAIHGVLLEQVVRLGDAQAVAQGFDRLGFPHCLGVVGETHIPILCSPHGASACLSGKGLVSVALQALVDSTGRFMDVHAGWSGDQSLPWGSPLLERMEQGAFGLALAGREVGGVATRPVLLGGPAWPLRPWLMKPYADASGRARERFNGLVGRCRKAAAKAFERLKGRWRCLLRRLDVAEKNIPLVVVACCILHNICEGRNEAMQEGWQEGLDCCAALPPRASDGQAGSSFPEAEAAGEAHNVREAFCAFFEKRGQEEDP